MSLYLCLIYYLDCILLFRVMLSLYVSMDVYKWPMAIVNQIWFTIILFLHFGSSGTRKQKGIIPTCMFIFLRDIRNLQIQRIPVVASYAKKREVLWAQTPWIETKRSLTKVNVFSPIIFHGICYDRWWSTKKNVII